MDISYIYHSGFLAETADANYIFDYYRGDIPIKDVGKPVFVFVSHRHPDHYNPQVFGILRRMGAERITGILASDIKPRNYPADENIISAAPDKKYILDSGAQVETLRSTDRGVAFVLTSKDKDAGKDVTVYHAGDLNDWVWEGEPESENRQMTGRYRKEIDKLKGRHIDAAFVPLDPRQESFCDRGMKYFLDTVDVDAVYPMHYWDQPWVIEAFAKKYPQYANKVRKNTD